MPGQKVIPYLLALLGLPASERHPLPQTSAEEQRNRTLSALDEDVPSRAIPGKPEASRTGAPSGFAHRASAMGRALRPG